MNNKVYNQAVFEWDVKDITDLTINWDLNRNRIFEIYDYREIYDPKDPNRKFLGKEFKVLDSVLTSPKGLFDKYPDDYFMILSDYSEPLIYHSEVVDPSGFCMRGSYSRYAFTFGNRLPDAYITIAHELGHLAFNLYDNTYKKRQPLNLMNHVNKNIYTKRIWLLKEQWKEI